MLLLGSRIVSSQIRIAINIILEYCPESDLFSNITESSMYVSDDSAIRKEITLS